jgi:hypothetical protein
VCVTQLQRENEYGISKKEETDRQRRRERERESVCVSRERECVSIPGMARMRPTSSTCPNLQASKSKLAADFLSCVISSLGATAESERESGKGKEASEGIIRSSIAICSAIENSTAHDTAEYSERRSAYRERVWV